MSRDRLRKIVRRKLLATMLCSALFYLAADDAAAAAAVPPANLSLYVKVQLKNSVKFSKLRPGDVIEGELARDVYASDQILFHAGSQVRLPVQRMERRRRASDDHWPWVVQAFTPRHEKYPVFETAVISGVNGEAALSVSLISLSRRREVYANTRKPGLTGSTGGELVPAESSRAVARAFENRKAPVMALEASGTDEKAVEGGLYSPQADLSGAASLPSGTACKIILLADISASRNRIGDTIQGRLIEPVFLNSHLVLPPDSLFEGKVVKTKPPRWGSRAGSLSLTFTSLTLPGGNRVPIAASPAGAELDRRSHTKIDAEGQLHGEHPGIAWMAINIGVTAGLAKEVDDTTQLIIEAIVSTATDVSTAGAARIVSSCVSGIFMISRRGRDVVLPRFTEMDITLDRPLSLPTREASNPANSPPSKHGN